MTFAPADQGQRSATLTVQSNGQNGPLTLSLSGTGVYPTTPFTVTPSADTGGTLNPNTAQLVSYGSTTMFSVTPNLHYHIAFLSGCSGTLVGNTYTTGKITANCTVAATFAIDTYAITTSTGTNGTVSPTGTATVNYGSSQTFAITPATGYHVSDALVDGASVGAVSSYTFTNVAANHAISASFAINTYTITATPGSSGTLSPSGNVVVNYGSSQTIAITPNTGNRVADVVVDGVSQGAISTYTFTNITSNHTISINWAVNTTCSNLPVRIGNTYYASIQTAYNTASDGATIQSQAVTLTENINSNRAITVTLDGGYDCNYSATKIGSTSLKGMLTTSAGTTTVKNIVLLQ